MSCLVLAKLISCLVPPLSSFCPTSSSFHLHARVHTEQHAFMKGRWQGDLGQDIFRIENCSRFMPIKIVVAYVFRKTTS